MKRVEKKEWKKKKGNEKQEREMNKFLPRFLKLFQMKCEYKIELNSIPMYIPQLLCK